MKQTLSKLKKKARPIFNKYIRLRDSDEHGYISCYTCGKKVHYKEANAGHFKHGLDFIEDNQRSQCVHCNMYNGGKLDIYSLKLIDELGRKRVDELALLKVKGQKLSRLDVEAIIETYKRKVKELEKVA